jgi:hypothetical protein
LEKSGFKGGSIQFCINRNNKKQFLTQFRRPRVEIWDVETGKVVYTADAQCRTRRCHLDVGELGEKVFSREHQYIARFSVRRGLRGLFRRQVIYNTEPITGQSLIEQFEEKSISCDH